ncbi:MAG: hypothetical protein SV375_16400 [Thermodesulfobacteriota bacterium]|nr:hypothetical protein [Thermodesulfobacteriota bacterium]
MKNEKQNGDEKGIVVSFYKGFRSFGTALPIILGTILILGLFRTFVSKEMLLSVFTGNTFQSTIIGALIGSVSTGNPVTSYIIGGELIKEHVNLIAITSFIVTWVTVGIIQLPAEVEILGRRFAFARNIMSFILSILVSITTVKTLMVIQ